MKHNINQIILIALMATVSLWVQAGDDFNQHRPDGVTDSKWNSLKAIVQETKLLATDGAADDGFGYSVSLSGDRALVGAYGDDDNGSQSGSAYIFDYDGVNWIQTAKLTDVDGAAFEYFGSSVSLSGNRALVGAYGDDDNGSQSGSAYIFDYDGVNWIQTTKFTASDGASNDWFGYSVSLSGDRALVGAYGDDDNASNSGSAYIFDYDGVNWIQTTKITANDGAVADALGISVSLSGDRALVGAIRDDDNGSNSGSAYIFDYDGVNWIQSAKLNAGDAAEGDWFGYSVSLSGDRALVGAFQDGLDSGSAYIFDYDGVNWIQAAKITANDVAVSDRFGYSVSLSGDRALVGAQGDDDNGSVSGSAYIFDYDGVNWVQTAKITASDGAEFDAFGRSVSLSGDRALVGASGGDDNGSDSGSAYVFNIVLEYDVNISVTGLAGGTLSLSNGADTLDMNINGTQIISTLEDGSNYEVNIAAQPTAPNQVCSFTNSNSGILNGSNVTVTVECFNAYTISGNSSGLAPGNAVLLTLNSGDEYLVVDSNSTFEFNNALEDGSDYEVTVFTNPTTPNQECTVINGSGFVAGSDVTDIQVVCELSEYYIGGYVFGLVPDNFMVLQNNNVDDLIVSSNGAFAFPAPLNDGDDYSVSIQTEPFDPIQPCEVLNSIGSVSGDDIDTVFVSCEFGDDLIYRHGFDSAQGIGNVQSTDDKAGSL